MWKFLKDESGSVTLLAAFGMIAIAGVLALAIDVGQLRLQRRNLQRAADAAALAGVLELSYCNGTPVCAAMQTAAKSAISENGLAAANVVVNCGTVPSTGLTLMINNGPCSQGSKDPSSGSPGSVEVVLSGPQRGVFSSLLGFTSIPLSARAEASRTSGSSCIFALDPSGSGALTVQGLAAITSACGIVVESTSSSALSCAFLGVIAASQISVVGGVSNFLCGISPTPKTGVKVPNPADPLAYLPTPTVPACGTTTTSPYHGAPSAVTVGIGNSATFYADGAYCGGINMQYGASAVFQPGTYALTSTNAGATRSPGGLTINLSSSVTGTGVTFYNYGPSGGIAFTPPSLLLSGVQLVAPTTGTYAGILFYQPASNTSAATLLGSSTFNTVLEGSYYFPRAKVTFALNGPVNYNILVAYDIVFEFLTFGATSVTSGFNNNYGSLTTGSPIAAGGALLSQ